MVSGGMTARVESVLADTLDDLHVRSEVGACLSDMLLDIETTHHLQQQLELEQAQKLLEKARTERQGVILEAHAERLERYDRRLGMADAFLKELLEANREVRELMEWKEVHEHKVRSYDAVVARLAATEEQLREAHSNGHKAAAAAAEEDPGGSGGEAAGAEHHEAGEPARSPIDAAANAESMPEETPESTTTVGNPTDTATATAAAAAVHDETPATTDPTTKEPDTPDPAGQAETEEQTNEVAGGGPQSTSSVEEDQKPPAHDAAVVSIDTEADSKEDVPTLLTLEMEPLMMIFGFLDAMDILNTAQINVTMYTKVDNIFGISEDGQSPPVPTPSKPPPPPKPTPPAVAETPAMKPPPPPPTEGGGSAAGGASPASAAGKGRGLFSMMQPAKAEAKQSQPLNAKVAQSMASKLSDAELAAIITMTNKLSKLEKEGRALRNEKVVLLAKLEGTEGVKQFLIGKVRDVEVKLQRSKEDEIKVTQQIASDQEVIAFLDGRVQELEQQTESLTMEKTGTQAGLDDLKVSTSKKITMLSDMLKYEREKVREDESDWKATKKVLVKEVKSCRAQILALQAERDGLLEQNDMLKRAVVSTGGGGKPQR